MMVSGTNNYPYNIKIMTNLTKKKTEISLKTPSL